MQQNRFNYYKVINMSIQDQLIEYITSDIIAYIMEDSETTMTEAMRSLYYSETFAKLNDLETGLYLESSPYVYDIYKTEKAYGKIVQEEI